MAAPVALPGRVHGRYASATVSGVTLHLFDWEVTFELETVDASAFGDLWRQPVALRQGWTARARGYFVSGTAAYLVAAAADALDPAAVTFIGYRSMTLTSGERVWEGSALITRCNFSAPMAMVEQEVELTGVGVPSFGF